MHCKKISIIKGCLYNYIDHKTNSLSSVLKKDKIIIYLEIYNLLKELLLKYDIYNLEFIVSNILCESIVSSLGEFYNPYSLAEKKDRYEQIEKIKNNKLLYNVILGYTGKHKQIYLIKILLKTNNIFILDLFFKKKKQILTYIRSNVLVKHFVTLPFNSE